MAVPVRPVASGRPGTRVIPDGWGAAHAVPVAGTRRATVSLRHPGGTPAWNETTQQTETVPFAPYAADQLARIQAVTNRAGGPVEAAGETVYVRGYLVALPVTVVDAKPGDLITVDACTDPTLVGRVLTVVDVLRGSEVWERDLFCTLND